jgi:hypothetical protein
MRRCANWAAKAVSSWLPLAAVLGAVAGGAASLSAAPGGESGFHLDRLPKGKSVTITKPATTFVPLSARATFTATDMPQSISLTPVNMRAGGAVPVLRVAIYDKNSSGVQYADIKPGTPFLYAFRDFTPIEVVAELPSGGEQADVTVRVESNKPLEIGH